MTEPEGHERARNERRDQMIRAAVRAFSVKGYSGATLADIAAEAHVTQPRISQVFGTKENAFIEAHRYAAQVIKDYFVPKAHPPYDASRLGRGYLELMSSCRPELMIIFQAFAASHCEAIGLEARAQMHEIISLLRQTGAGYPEIRDFLARGFIMKIALASDISNHLDESEHFEPLLDSLHLPVPPTVDPGAAALRRQFGN